MRKRFDWWSGRDENVNNGIASEIRGDDKSVVVKYLNDVFCGKWNYPLCRVRVDST